MDLLEFIVQRHAEKFVRDTQDDLWAYQRFLEKRNDEESKRMLTAVKKKLGITEPKLVVAKSPSKPQVSKEERTIRDKAISAIKHYFNR